MEEVFTEQIFAGRVFSPEALPPGEYEDCRFGQCDFSGTSLTGRIFIGCEMIGCNLSLVPVVKISFREILVTECKMPGLHFEDADPFAWQCRFENCVLNQKAKFSLSGMPGLLEQYNIIIDAG